MKKLLSVAFLFSLVISFISVSPNVNAMEIPEGATIKTIDNPDVYIIKYKNGKQFKRLVLNPDVFESYGHLRWEDILTVSQNEMDSFVVSDLVRVDGQTDIYQLVPNGDVGTKVLLTLTDDYDLDLVYTINEVDFGNYVMGKVAKAITLEQLQKPDEDIIVPESEGLKDISEVEDIIIPQQPRLIFFEDNLSNIYTEEKDFIRKGGEPFNHGFGASCSPLCTNGVVTEDCHSEIINWVNNRSIEIGKTLNITVDSFDANGDDVFYYISYGSKYDRSYGTMRVMQSWKTNNVFNIPITEQLFNETLSDNLGWGSHFFDSSTRIHYNKNVQLNNASELNIKLCFNEKPEQMEPGYGEQFSSSCILFKYFILKPGYSDLTTSIIQL